MKSSKNMKTPIESFDNLSTAIDNFTNELRKAIQPAVDCLEKLMEKIKK